MMRIDITSHRITSRIQAQNTQIRNARPSQQITTLAWVSRFLSSVAKHNATENGRYKLLTYLRNLAEEPPGTGIVFQGKRAMCRPRGCHVFLTLSRQRDILARLGHQKTLILSSCYILLHPTYRLFLCQCPCNFLIFYLHV